MQPENDPILIEPGVKYFISSALKGCSLFTETYTNYMFNISMTLLFLFLLSTFLIYKYKGKLTLKEKEIKERKKQEYILSKLQQLNFHKKQKQKEENVKDMITDLPQWSY